jgi:aminoglycoside 6'-N-acetyltransferase
VLVRYLFEARGHHRLTIDPAAHNERAIRCYEAVGFTPVGVLRQYERDDDGSWHDGLLMQLLADDWRAQ